MFHDHSIKMESELVCSPLRIKYEELIRRDWLVLGTCLSIHTATMSMDLSPILKYISQLSSLHGVTNIGFVSPEEV